MYIKKFDFPKNEVFACLHLKSADDVKKLHRNRVYSETKKEHVWQLRLAGSKITVHPYIERNSPKPKYHYPKGKNGSKRMNKKATPDIPEIYQEPLLPTPAHYVKKFFPKKVDKKGGKNLSKLKVKDPPPSDHS